ncbi:phage tail tube protein [Streptosporangium saharense]|uniref:phage tail tube protein n=1 Tax=Streptosporangium saharense TaxID=1706840 RepID=UPI00368855F1
MAKRKINARDIIFEVSDGAVSPAWLPVKGLTGVNVNPGENEESVETTDFDSQGAYEQEILQRGASLELEGFLLKDDTTGAQDPGQARVEEMGGEDALGADSLGQVRFRHPMDDEWKVWTCTFSLAEQGGGNNDKSSWGATVTRSGRSSTVAVTP